MLHSKISNNDFESNTALEVLEDQFSAEFLRCKFLVQDQTLQRRVLLKASVARVHSNRTRTSF